MDILFIHSNYPGQFRNLAPAISNGGNNRVIFLTERDDEEMSSIEGITIRQFKPHRKTSAGIHNYLMTTEEAVIKGQGVFKAIIGLLEEGFNPSIVIYHGGMGIGLYLKEILPNAKTVGYFEWYFLPETSQYLVEEFDINTKLSGKMRNIPILLELKECDVGVVPTEWQKSQFPKEYHQKLNIIFDGIDRRYFNNRNNEQQTTKRNGLKIKNRETLEKFEILPESKIITYATRGMEPLRCFPEFMEVIPSLLKEVDNLKIVIAGADRQAYSYGAPTKNGSWKDYLLEKLGNFYGKENIIFTGLLDYEDYRSLLWRSNLHCYFTRPYVTSWSYFEAAACACNLATNKSGATEDIVEESSIHWVDIDNKECMKDKLLSSLLDKNVKKAKLLENYGLDEALNEWSQLLNRELKK